MAADAADMIRARVTGRPGALVRSLTAKSARIALAEAQFRKARAASVTAHWQQPGLLWPIFGKR